MKYPLLNTIGDYLTFIFKTIGLLYDKKKVNQEESKESGNVEAIITPYMNALTKFREKVKSTKDFGE